MASSRGEVKTGGIVKLDMIDVLEKRKKEKQKGLLFVVVSSFQSRISFER